MMEYTELSDNPNSCSTLDILFPFFIASSRIIFCSSVIDYLDLLIGVHADFVAGLFNIVFDNTWHNVEKYAQKFSVHTLGRQHTK